MMNSRMFKLLTHPRKRLSKYQNLDDAVELIRNSQRIVVLSGAGISVSCGIPDFRSKGGFYSRLADEGIEPPEKVFDIEYFSEDPSLFYKYGGLIMPTKFTPSLTHRFIAKLDQEGKLLKNYTQNIDNLEVDAGAVHVRHCHGTMGKATCMKCGKEISVTEIRSELEKGEIAYCKYCTDKEPGVMKPNVVFFGEALPSEYFSEWEEDQGKCDLMIVVGTSLKVTPVATMIADVAYEVPQMLVNREKAGPKDHFDMYLLGNCDDVFGEIAKRLGWDLTPASNKPQEKKTESTIKVEEIAKEVILKEEKVEKDEGLKAKEVNSEEKVEESTISSSTSSSSVPSVNETEHKEKTVTITFIEPNTTIFRGDDDLEMLEKEISALSIKASKDAKPIQPEEKALKAEDEKKDN
ncbi:putative NAD-dependent protein deacetylase sirtuin-1 [Monocercomonoides exilis]|uniref:putative NAD-dependent protein deacetylase sirtuin-1 n=1 Tax=Monocercomonoides exilis TaxID=2049356 RepID=UPI003559A391|nr:putative NAD-dependent protein deacetylase sirtuin-1 [Monocercomonoides exilis]|eukprot:MONOS_3190.1-p1 / transcript=MONOS_3190.1 / gene=MONOS_3190 / organism=Monocercomonoides_exilis_PA203 / gene_product=Chain A, Structure Of Nad-dependent Protein Deacetylase Sirtuin-1 / transcript_product=Chain A, Structure Of Nad-dependent Protein Deacetylase Sirtuin-1 / location=Mono_scaffold00073:28171-29743(+) / protein_length=406 / sequence_SO=supercontig / SO=protein_coding / is_pseudo=false